MKTLTYLVAQELMAIATKMGGERITVQKNAEIRQPLQWDILDESGISITWVRA